MTADRKPLALTGVGNLAGIHVPSGDQIAVVAIDAGDAVETESVTQILERYEAGIDPNTLPRTAIPTESMT